ncbi:MAG TPA: glycosyltransferase [Patescibacteria group bacterium]|nr:glycosyltransferase [Patescibacteria group bacterium]
MRNLSIIVPTWNEEGNVKLLVERLHAALFSNNIVYEIIFVDDNSTDKTQEIILSLAKDYPVSFYSKIGKKGKAHSLIEGFSYAKHDILCMIDADIQYPPESIPEMIQKIIAGADIVVANRKKYHSSKLRKFLSNSFKNVFGNLFFKLNHDIQSGLKVFKKEVLETIIIIPESGWTFDLEFLHRASHAGFRIENHDITFTDRNSGKSKVSFIKTSIEIGLQAIKTSMKPLHPLHVRPQHENTMEGAGIRYKKNKYVTHTTLPHHVSAINTFHPNQKIIIGVLLSLVIAGLFYNPLGSLLGLIAILSAIYFIDVLFNFYLVWKSLHFEKALSFTNDEIQAIDETTLPVYSILCPLYKEAHVIPQFVDAISKLDYPKDKLDVMLLLEEDDTDSIEAVKTMSLPYFVRTVIVPDSLPKTKPKACNYGLAKAKGEYLVIFDAEDIPEVDQLKKAYLGFQKAGKDVLCLQAKLNYYNPHHNLLTRLFTAEYSLWFDVSLTGLQALDTNIPLGGTSNHFRIKDLQELQGWDPFNVTEDADLGIRLFKKGFKTAIIDSTTYEEANSRVINWIRQRSRWIKGYMQTYLVHTREIFGMKGKKKRHSLIFHLVIGGKIAFILINPFLWLATISYFALYNIVGPTIEYLYPSYVFYMAATSLVLGNFLFIYYYMIGAIKREQWGLIKFIFLVPFYWILISTAGFMALYQLLFKPHYWEKTVHGFHLLSKETEGTKEKKEPKVSPVGWPAFRPAFARIFPVIASDRQGTRQFPWNLKFVSDLVLRISNLSKKEHVFSGSILVFAMVFANFLNFVFNAYLGRVLTFEAFGLVSLINSFFYLTAIPFGALGTTMSYRAGFLEERYGKESAYSFWSNLKYKLLNISLIVSILWLLSTPFLTGYFNIDNLFPVLLFTPVWLIGLLTAANRGFLNGKLMFTAIAALAILDPIVKLVTAFTLVQINLSEWVYVSIPLSVVLGYLLTVTFMNRVKPQQTLETATPHTHTFPYKFFFVSALSGISAITFLSLDVIMAKHFLSAKDAGQYALVSLVGKMVFFISTLFAVFIIPFVSRNEGAKKDSSHILDWSLLMASTLASLGFIFVGVFGHITVPILLGEKALTIVPYLLPFTFAVGCFAIATVFMSYYLTKKVYSFSVVTFFLALMQLIAISLFHQNIAAIVQVMLYIGYANLVLMVLLHIAIQHITVIENNIKDFFGIFAKVTVPQQTEKNLRILIFNWRDTKHRWAGGAEVYVQEIASRWVKEGHSVTLFCGNDSHSPRNQVIDGVKIVRRGGFMTVYFWAAVYYLFKFRNKYDVIVDAENGIPFLTPLYVKKPIFLLIHHVHQEVFRNHLIFPLSVIASFIESKLMPYLYKNRTIITVSESSKKEIIKLGFKEEQIHVIHPGINNDLFYKTEKAKVPTFVYLGRLQPYKNVDVLIKAFNKIAQDFRSAKLLIAGSGESASDIKKLVQRFNLEKRVTFLGKVTEEEKIKLLGYAWAAVQPSQVEGWGITVIEANACGTPVIASNVNGLRDSIVADKTGILVGLKNTDQFADAMLSVITNAALRDNLSNEAHIWSQHFNWDVSSSAFLTILINEYQVEKKYAMNGELALQKAE